MHSDRRNADCGYGDHNGSQYRVRKYSTPGIQGDLLEIGYSSLTFFHHNGLEILCNRLAFSSPIRMAAEPGSPVFQGAEKNIICFIGY